MGSKRKAKKDVPVDRPAKKKSKYLSENRSLATLYDKLADERLEVRLRAAGELIEGLVDSDGTVSKDSLAIFKRLIGGLSSGRKAARAGFFVALSEFLQLCKTNQQLFESTIGELEYRNVKGGSIRGLLNYVRETTETNPDSRGDTRDRMLGRVAAYKAILQSGLLMQTTISTIGEFEGFLDNVINPAGLKLWLREEYGSLLYEFVATYQSPQPTKDIYLESIVGKLTEHHRWGSAEGIAIWLTMQKNFPELKLPEGVWYRQDPLHSTERARLAGILHGADSTSGEDKEVKPKDMGAWKPSPHFAWQIVIKHAQEAISKNKKFREFITAVVDDSFFAEDVSQQCKYWGFSLFAWAIRTLPSANLSCLFPPKFMRSLKNHRRNLPNVAKSTLYGAAGLVLTAIESRAKQDPGAGSTLFTGMVETELSFMFDQSTGGTALRKTFLSASDEGKESISEKVVQFIIKPTSAEDAIEASKERGAAIHLLVFSATQTDTTAEKGEPALWMNKIGEELALLSYATSIEPGRVPKPAFSQKDRTSFQDGLMRFIKNVLPRVSRPDQYLNHIARKTWETTDSSEYSLAVKMDKPIRKTLKASSKALRELEKGKLNIEISVAIQVLLSLVMLEVFGGDADCSDMLNELNEVYANLKEGETDPKIFGSVVEMLLSFLSRQSNLYSQVADLIFPVIMRSMSEDHLDSLLDIISKPETQAGQAEIFHNMDDDLQDAAEGSDSDVSMDSDVEAVAADDDKNGEDVSDADSGTDSDDEEADSELENFNTSLAQALKTSIPMANGDADPPDESDEESDMDDDQMFALDDQLSNIFKQRASRSRKNGKKEKRNVEVQMINFKRRVLNLIKTYVDERFSEAGTLKVIMPVLSLMRISSSSVLHEQAQTIIKVWIETCDKHNKYPIPAMHDDLWELLSEVHQEARTNAPSKHDIACSRASRFLARILVDADPSYITRICQQYAETQASTLLDTKSADVHHSFFSEWTLWCVERRKKNLRAEIRAKHEAKEGQGIGRKKGEAWLKSNKKVPLRLVKKVGKDGKVQK